MITMNLRATSRALIKLDELGFITDGKDIGYPIKILTNGRKVFIEYLGKRVKDFDASFTDANAVLNKGGVITRRIFAKIKEIFDDKSYTEQEPNQSLQFVEGFHQRIKEGRDVIDRLTYHFGAVKLMHQKPELKKYLIDPSKISKFEESTGIKFEKGCFTSKSFDHFRDEWLELISNVVTVKFGK